MAPRNQTAAVIGAGDFIGASIAKKLAAEGFTLFVGRRNGKKLAPLIKEIEVSGGSVFGRSLDARKEEEIVSFLSDADKQAPLEVCVFNIGANVNFPLLDTTERVFRKVWEMACYSGFLTGREAARLMLKHGRGSIFFTGATASLRGGVGYAAFASAKFGLRAVAQAAARELWPKNIHVIITALTQKTPELLGKEIARCRDMTDKPFGVNLTFLPMLSAPPYPEYIAAIIEGGVKIVETAGRSPEAYMPALKAAGIKVIHKCTSVRHSLKAERIGCDAVSVDGFECGGHPGEDDIPNMILLPRAADELKIPFIASGGMADARSLVAVLALGAAGMNMGTRFIATKEAPVHDKVKQAIVAASELDTRLVMRPLRNTERVLKNASVDRLLEIERAKGADLQISDIKEQVASVYPKIMLDGDMDAGAWSCGMVVGLIHDIPTVAELIDRDHERG